MSKTQGSGKKKISLDTAQMSAIVLAGGQSRRIGQDKAWLEIGGKSIIQRVLGQLKPLFSEVILVGGDSPRLQKLGVNVIPDELPGQGPLGGLSSGLKVCDSEWVFCCACDMPFLNQDLIAALAGYAKQSDALICDWNGKLQPLHGFYHKNCLPVIQEYLENKQYRLMDVLSRLQVRYVDKDFIIKHDPLGHSFFNLNTPEALTQAKDIIGTI